MTPQVLYGQEALSFVTNSRRPVVNERGLVVNSFLDKREWAQLDTAIVKMVKLRLMLVSDLRSKGLVKTTTLAEMLSQWRVSSERIAATVNMDGRSQVNRDRTDKKVYGVPLPIISADYTIGRRELLASRRLGSDIDTAEAEEAAASVAEKAEDITFNGDSTIVVNSNTLYGVTTISGRETDTASNYGGGDFGTISNIVPTFQGMLSALAANRYHGPFGCYVYPTQYQQMLSFYTDGSGQTALQRVESLPQIEFVKPGDLLDDGETVMVQMTSNVIDLVIGMELENRQWESPDGTELFFKVMMAMAPRLKTDYAGNVGIAHATSC